MRDFVNEEVELGVRAGAAPFAKLVSPVPVAESVGRQRLRILADFLPTVPGEQFDMSNWIAGGRELEQGCGTSGCAAGWAGTIDAFRAVGYRCGQDGPRFDGRSDWSALAAFFGISNDDALNLFCPMRAAESPSQVAARIREHLVQTADAPARRSALVS